MYIGSINVVEIEFHEAACPVQCTHTYTRIEKDLFVHRDIIYYYNMYHYTYNMHRLSRFLSDRQRRA